MSSVSAQLYILYPLYKIISIHLFVWTVVSFGMHNAPQATLGDMTRVVYQKKQVSLTCLASRMRQWLGVSANFTISYVNTCIFASDIIQNG